VPLGVHRDVLDCTTSGCPFESTRVVPVSHCAETQGPLPEGGGGNEQPATMYEQLSATLGAPPSVTREFGEVGVACPA
jgi:hypothetical protein